MTSTVFFSYRVTALKAFIEQQLNQLKQLGVIAMLFMYTAIPGLVLLLYLALGKVLTQDSELGVILAIALLIAQSEISAALASGVLDTKHRLFQRSLVNKPMRVAIDVVLALITNIGFMLCLPLLLSLSPTQFLLASHFLLFVLLMALCGLFATFKPYSVKPFVLGLLVIFLLFESALAQLLWLTLAWLIVLICWPNGIGFVRFKSINFGFWASYHCANLNQLWWRGLFLLALVMCANIIYVNRPDLAFFIHCLVSPFILYLASSQQLNQNQVIDEYKLWLNSLGNAKQLLLGQLVAPLALGFTGLLMLQWLAVNKLSLIIFSIALLAGVILAIKRANTFALSWFAINATVVTICYWLYTY